MIVDLILDRKDDIELYGYDYNYNAHDFYYDVLGYEAEFDFDPYISMAMDYGTEKDVKAALCKYIDMNDYNPDIKDFINSVDWID